MQDIAVNSMDTALSNNDLLAGSHLAAIYSKNGFEFFEVINFYSQKSMRDPAPTVPVEEAINTMTAKFESIMMEYVTIW